MKKVMQMSEKVSERLGIIRKSLFNSESSSEYRDSFVLNEAIERFSAGADALLSKEIAEKDCEPRVAKSLTLRADIFAKLTDLATLTDLSYAEVTRRIILFTVDEIEKNKQENSRENTEYERAISTLKQKLLVAVRYLEQSTTALNSILEEIEALEENEEGTVE